MPTFPSYDGPPLPQQLNPINPRHWLLLLDWIFFHPSRLKQYLYRADPKLYVQEGAAALRTGLQQPAYRALLPTSLLVMLVVPSALWGLADLVGVEVNWLGVAFVVALGVVLGVVLGVAFGVASGVAYSVALGVVYSVALGVVFSVAFGVAFVVAYSVAGGVTVGVVLGVAFVVALGVADSVAFSVAFSVVVGVVSGVVVGVVSGVVSGVVVGVVSGVSVLFGSLHNLSSVCELIGLVRAQPFLSELGVLPPPHCLSEYYWRRLVMQPDAACGVLRSWLRNPFRSHTAFRLLNRLLNDQVNPLSLFYLWLQAPQAREFIAEPVSNEQFRRFPTVRRLLLGGLGNTFVDRSGGQSATSERVAWRMASWFYGSTANHGLVALAQLLLALDQLGDEPDAGVARLPALLPRIATLDGLQDIQHGHEIITTFTWLAQGYNVTSVIEIAKLQPALASAKLTFPTPLRPAVVELISALADIGQEIVDYVEFSNPGAQGAALNRALGLLNELDPQVELLNLPERGLLAAVVHHWQQIIAEEAGRIGERVLREMNDGGRLDPATLIATGVVRQSKIWRRPTMPFANPYVTGRPVTGSNFVGRADLIQRVAARWQANHTPDSIILYGHRRMGKTSILKNLAGSLPNASLLVYLDLKGVMAVVDQLGDLLLAFAEAIHAVAAQRLPNLPEPQPSDYQQSASAALYFQRLLRAVLGALPTDAFLVLALDEFEALEQAVKEETLTKDVYNYLRMLSQQSQVTLVLAGLHTLDEMSRDYQQAFFNSYVNLQVSYLAPADAERLITRPTPDFTLNYERTVVDELYHCTHGQPLLIQSICDALVCHLNHELFDLETEREARILSTDLAAVLTDDFLRKEIRYFEGVWRDQLAAYPDQQAILHALARVDSTQTPVQLVTQASLALDKVQEALQALKKRDIVIAENDNWRLIMPLFQRWLRLHDAQPEIERQD